MSLGLQFLETLPDLPVEILQVHSKSNEWIAAVRTAGMLFLVRRHRHPRVGLIDFGASSSGTQHHPANKSISILLVQQGEVTSLAYFCSDDLGRYTRGKVNKRPGCGTVSQKSSVRCWYRRP